MNDKSLYVATAFVSFAVLVTCRFWCNEIERHVDILAHAYQSQEYRLDILTNKLEDMKNGN